MYRAERGRAKSQKLSTTIDGLVAHVLAGSIGSASATRRRHRPVSSTVKIVRPLTVIAPA
jgi:hypothetical protein